IEIKRIHTQMRLTTLYVTHDQSEAMSMSDLVVVMRAGRIEQQGAPQEIYDRPQSLYVATFMGYANRLRGTIVGQEDERWRVQTAHSASLLATAPRHDATTLHTGQAVTLCFRPDDTFTTPTPETNQMQGRVQLVEYLGKSFESVVWLPGAEPTQILAHSPQAPSFDNELT